MGSAGPASAEDGGRHGEHLNQTCSESWSWTSVLLVFLSLIL